MPSGRSGAVLKGVGAAAAVLLSSLKFMWGTHMVFFREAAQCAECSPVQRQFSRPLHSHMPCTRGGSTCAMSSKAAPCLIAVHRTGHRSAYKRACSRLAQSSTSCPGSHVRILVWKGWLKHIEGKPEQSSQETELLLCEHRKLTAILTMLHGSAGRPCTTRSA